MTRGAGSLITTPRPTPNQLLSKAGSEVAQAWRDGSTVVMLALLRDKFKRNPKLKDKLMETGHRVLVHRNGYNDTFWGIANGKGTNHLGRLLEQVREELVPATSLRPG